MSLVTQTLKKIYTLMTDKNNPIYLPKILLGNEQVKAILSQDRKGIDLPLPLSGACTTGSTEGNATLDLLQPDFSLETIQGTGFSATANEDYTEFGFSITASGQRVPAHHEDCVCPKLGVTDPIVGPLSLSGITDFTGPRLAGSFNCFQKCTVGGTVMAPGRFIATLNNVTLKMGGKLVISQDVNAPMTVSIDTFSIDGIAEENMTLTLLHKDGTLPVYEFKNLDKHDAASVHFFFAQLAINCPPIDKPSIFTMLADTYNEEFKSNGDLIRKSIADAVNALISSW